ncbi:hypothetical protein CL616_05150 [archaeon]|nr:hypothetical protein [archaeon]
MTDERAAGDGPVAKIIGDAVNLFFYPDKEFKVNIAWIFADIKAKRKGGYGSNVTGQISEYQNKKPIKIKGLEIDPTFLGQAIAEIIESLYNWDHIYSMYLSRGVFGNVCKNQEHYNDLQTKVNLAKAITEYMIRRTIEGRGAILMPAEVYDNKEVMKEFRKRLSKFLGY